VERRRFFTRFIWAFPVMEVQEMEQRDWELLDKQMRGLSTPRNDAIMVLTDAAVFFAGKTLGGFLFPREGEVESRRGGTATTRPNGAPPTARQLQVKVG
jgi:hypothetical protein